MFCVYSQISTTPTSYGSVVNTLRGRLVRQRARRCSLLFRLVAAERISVAYGEHPQPLASVCNLCLAWYVTATQQCDGVQQHPVVDILRHARWPKSAQQEHSTCHVHSAAYSSGRTPRDDTALTRLTPGSALFRAGARLTSSTYLYQHQKQTVNSFQIEQRMSIN